MIYLTYDGKNLSDFGVIIDKSGAYTVSDRDYETQKIPGRNGELTLDNGRYKNVSIKYTCTIGRGFQNNMDHFLQWLMSKQGYHRLEDSARPEYYRIARLVKAPSPDIRAHFIGGTFDLEFDCKPQRFLRSGEQKTVLSANGSIWNPTLYEALPLIRVYGAGTLGVGSETITILSADGYTDIDCDIQDAYKGQANCNGNIRLDSGSFPVLKPGSNGLSLGTGITSIEITPRWWTV